MARTESRPASDLPTVQGALGRIGRSHPTVATLVVVASGTTHASPETVWDTWVHLDRWPTWSKPLHVSARWLDGRAWEVGAKFEQVLDWGFPFGKTVSIDTVREVNPGQSVSWWKTAHGINSCHIWFFEPTHDGGTHVVKTEVFIGPVMLFTKLFIRTKWRQLFHSSVQGLIRASERAGTGSDTLSS